MTTQSEVNKDMGIAKNMLSYFVYLAEVSENLTQNDGKYGKNVSVMIYTEDSWAHLHFLISLISIFIFLFIIFLFTHTPHPYHQMQYSG